MPVERVQRMVKTPFIYQNELSSSEVINEYEDVTEESCFMIKTAKETLDDTTRFFDGK